MPLSPTIPLGAFTNQTVAAINSALAQAGLAATTGNIFYVDPVNGLDTNNGQVPNSPTVPSGVGPVQTLQAGYNLLRSGYNDVLVLLSNGATSGTARLGAGFTWAKNSAHLVGVGPAGRVGPWARIAPTLGIAAFANFFTITGSGCIFSNINWFQGFTAGVAASICVTLKGGAQGNAFLGCAFQGMGDVTSATDAGSRCLLITGGAQENYFYGCYLGIDTVERTNANATVEIAGGGPRNIFEKCIFPFWSSDGLQYALLGAAAAAIDRWVLFIGCQFIATVAGAGVAIAAAFHLVATVGGILCFDSTSGLFNFTAIGDATTKAQIFVSGGTATDGVKGIVAT